MRRRRINLFARCRSARLPQPVEPLERRLLLADILGSKYNDLNRNGTRDPGEPGMAGWVVYLDADASGTYDGVAQSSGNVPVHIPDLGTATSTLSIAGFSGTVGHLTVSLNITHGYDPDLSADLTSPAGTHVNLFGGLSGRGVNFDNTTFDDNAATLVTDTNGFGSYTGY